MALTVSGLLTKLAKLVGKDPAVDTADLPNQQTALQYALNMIDLSQEWLWQRATGFFDPVNGIAEYNLSVMPSLSMVNLHQVKAVYLLDPFLRVEMRDEEYFLRNLAGQSRTGPSAYYWMTGPQTITLWPTPVTATIKRHYVIHRQIHGDITANPAPAILIPQKYEMVVLHLAKQCYKGQIGSLDQMIGSDPYISMMFDEMKRNESPVDVTYETIESFPEPFEFQLGYTLNLS